MLKAAETHAQPDATTLERTACVYTSCYCEENALLLSRRLVDSGVVPAPECLYVLFVTNRLRQTPLWCQRAASDEDGLVVWDYHVFVIEAAHGRLRRARVWDLDTRLPFPCSLDDYTHAALRPVRAPVYRVVPAADLWRHFASDRSHMRLPEGGWSAAPPPYPCLGPQDGVRAVTLQQYLDVREAYEGHSQEPGAPPEATWEASLPPVRHQAKQQRPQAPPSHAEAPRALRAGGDDRRRAADQLLGGEGGGPGLLGPGGLRLPGGSAAAEGRPWVREVGPASAGQPQGLDPADEPEGPHLAHASARTRDLLRRSKGLPKEELLDLAEDARLRGNEAFKAGDVRDAVDAYTLALNLAPSDARLFANRAAAFMRLKRWPDMLADADGALALEPANVKALLRRAEALRNMGLRHQALEAARTASPQQQQARAEAGAAAAEAAARAAAARTEQLKALAEDAAVAAAAAQADADAGLAQVFGGLLLSCEGGALFDAAGAAGASFKDIVKELRARGLDELAQAARSPI
ncbi:WDYHV motif containing 1 [Monoraphidium neglectum]|uniref:Protein N-terminal glutamine amidohydrolase n=1 Tax=Monoraphidium neglectum TaxID=145388 RepID=A0A0D2LVD5_9CHLO|nr:WDYHV motif containing 1 [Monoraphidium neglectum]KIY95534.1 WDYHV motif containing 1 [Monoraphidium neglectum]|eukprot:XP_013894554.1 WDYHV motif containing 1 [Monoraphidium neglectum]